MRQNLYLMEIPASQCLIRIIDVQAREPRWYVQPVAARMDDNGIYSFEVAPDEGLLVRDEEGYWITAIQFMISPESQFSLTYLIRFILRDSMCEMGIGLDRRDFTFPIQDAAKRKPAFDYMVELIRVLFTLKPWASAARDRIGFLTGID